MILAGDFRKGITVEIDGQVWSIADFQHVKPGKGAAFVRTRLKNVMTGAVLERTFSPTDKYPTAHIDTREMQYLYNDGDLYYFMDNETYEQLALNHDQVEDAIDFIVENSNVTIRFFKGSAFSVAVGGITGKADVGVASGVGVAVSVGVGDGLSIAHCVSVSRCSSSAVA